MAFEELYTRFRMSGALFRRAVERGKVAFYGVGSEIAVDEHPTTRETGIITVNFLVLLPRLLSRRDINCDSREKQRGHVRDF